MAAQKAYASHSAFFPLIAATLAGSQTGRVFVDNVQRPRQFYVEHTFGFSQVFGDVMPDFEDSLQNYLLGRKDFLPTKIRLYTPYSPPFCNVEVMQAVRAERQRFFIDSHAYRAARHRLMARRGSQASAQLGDHSCSSETVSVSQENVAIIDAVFSLVTRFWPDAASFIAHSLAHVALQYGQPAAVCYAAAVENGRAEIDILTLPQFRGKGLGLLAAVAFIDACIERNIVPLWDCFTNNAGSMALRERLGFVICTAPYSYYTITR